MMDAIRQLDRLLHGEATAPDTLAQDRFDFPIAGLAAVLAALGMIYGACMGLFAVLGSGSGHGMQVFASSVKLPMLFLLTLVVTFPSLYVFNGLFGSRLRLPKMLRLMVSAMAITLAVLSSMGPIVGFFGVSSTSYAFMVVLNVVVFATAGFLGLGFLLQTLHRLSGAGKPAPIEVDAEGVVTTADFAEPPSSPLVHGDDRPITGGTRLIFRV